jgi:hypothetical protein
MAAEIHLRGPWWVFYIWKMGTVLIYTNHIPRIKGENQTTTIGIITQAKCGNLQRAPVRYPFNKIQSLYQHEAGEASIGAWLAHRDILRTTVVGRMVPWLDLQIVGLATYRNMMSYSNREGTSPSVLLVFLLRCLFPTFFWLLWATGWMLSRY